MPPPPRVTPAVAAVLLSAAAALLAAPRAADACSTSCNDPGFFVPGDGATVPANLPGIFWRARYDAGPGGPPPSNVTLTATTDPETPLGFTAMALAEYQYLLVPDAPLVAGTTYHLADASACDFGTGVPSASATFTVGPSAPLPTTLGALAVTQLPLRTDTIASGGGSCSMEAVVASAAVAVDYTQASDAAPWRDVLHFETLVDGQRWLGRRDILTPIAPGASWVGRGFDRIYTMCSTDDPFSSPANQASPGTHQVQLRATLPGTTVALATTTAAIELTCPPPDDPGPDGGLVDLDDAGGCCSSASRPGASAVLALLVALAVVRPARSRRRRFRMPPERQVRSRSRC